MNMKTPFQHDQEPGKQNDAQISAGILLANHNAEAARIGSEAEMPPILDEAIAREEAANQVIQAAVQREMATYVMAA